MARVRPPAGDSSKKFDPSPVERLFVLLAVEHPYAEHLFPERSVVRQSMVQGAFGLSSSRPSSSGADWIAPGVPDIPQRRPPGNG